MNHIADSVNSKYHQGKGPQQQWIPKIKLLLYILPIIPFYVGYVIMCSIGPTTDAKINPSIHQSITILLCWADHHVFSICHPTVPPPSHYFICCLVSLIDLKKQQYIVCMMIDDDVVSSWQINIFVLLLTILIQAGSLI